MSKHDPPVALLATVLLLQCSLLGLRGDPAIQAPRDTKITAEEPGDNVNIDRDKRYKVVADLIRQGEFEKAEEATIQVLRSQLAEGTISKRDRALLARLEEERKEKFGTSEEKRAFISYERMKAGLPILGASVPTLETVRQALQERGRLRTEASRIFFNKIFGATSRYSEEFARFFLPVVKYTSDFDASIVTADGCAGLIPMNEAQWTFAVDQMLADGEIENRIDYEQTFVLGECPMNS